MILFLLSFAVVTLAIIAMAVGVILGRAPIKGSCGGLGNTGGCEWCDGKCRRSDAARQPVR